jgi:hypothetical protein
MNKQLDLILFGLIADAQHDIGHHLCEQDYSLLLNTMNQCIPAMINKFIRGAKEHPLPLVEKVTPEDLLAEAFDQVFYAKALQERFNNERP